jgi:hypothetical protein
MSDEPAGYPWAAGAFLVLAAVLLGGFVFWVYRMMILGGSVIGAWQRAISLGWDVVAFVAITLGGSVLCMMLALSFLAPRDRH